MLCLYHNVTGLVEAQNLGVRHRGYHRADDNSVHKDIFRRLGCFRSNCRVGPPDPRE
jgi:hypothetical protein